MRFLCYFYINLEEIIEIYVTMEPSAIKNKSLNQPKPIADLLPGLSGILSEDALLTLTAKKKPRPAMAQTRTAEKTFKPLTLAEIQSVNRALKPYSPRRPAQNAPSVIKKWNTSVKVDVKKICHTSDGQLKNNPVRKALNFQPKPKPIQSSRMTMLTADTPKFPKPEYRAKKPLHHLQAKNNVRISGITNIPQTPVELIKQPIKSRMTMANKENNPYKAPSLLKKILAPPTPQISKISTPKVDTPLLNSSWKSGSDASFLLKEKEIHEEEKEKLNGVAEEAILKAFTEKPLENIAEGTATPPASTPFKEYRSVQEYFNNSSCAENSALYDDNTIMCFDKPSICIENENKEESVIVSLCELFNKATVNNTENPNTLLEVKRQTEQNIKMIENGISLLTKIKESQVKSLENVKKLLTEKSGEHENSENLKDMTLIPTDNEMKMSIDKTLSPEKSPIVSRPCSVIKSSRSPSYKIPKKNIMLRRKVICKSMPNVSGLETPVKDFEGRALNMYMKMKEQMNFLSTPMVNRDLQIPDTPAVTSHNLQKQLDKLYGS